MYDLAPACLASGVYSESDSQGSSFNVNVCAAASTPCIRRSADNVTAVGAIVKFTGQRPSCGNKATSGCTDPFTGTPACCSQPCDAIAVWPPVAWTETTNDPRGGFQLVFAPVPISGDAIKRGYCVGDDGYQASEYHTILQLECNVLSRETRVHFIESRNTSAPCDYVIHVQSPQGCAVLQINELVFGILCIAAAFALYLLIGTGVMVLLHRRCTLPHGSWWAACWTKLIHCVRRRSTVRADPDNPETRTCVAWVRSWRPSSTVTTTTTSETTALIAAPTTALAVMPSTVDSTRYTALDGSAQFVRERGTAFR